MSDFMANMPQSRFQEHISAFQTPLAGLKGATSKGRGEGESWGAGCFECMAPPMNWRL